MNEFKIDVKDKIVLDVGASTGGFTDCLLQYGAGFIYAIDVGYGQLAWKLRENKKVKVLERTNIRYLTFEKLYSGSDKIANFSVIDVSFISLKKVIKPVVDLLEESSEIIPLIKPQFEAGKEYVKKGIVYSSKIHEKVILDLLDFFLQQELIVKDITFSPIKGPAGNIEFFLYLIKSKHFDSSKNITQDKIFETVKQAHESL